MREAISDGEMTRGVEGKCFRLPVTKNESGRPSETS